MTRPLQGLRRSRFDLPLPPAPPTTLTPPHPTYDVVLAHIQRASNLVPRQLHHSTCGLPSNPYYLETCIPFLLFFCCFLCFLVWGRVDGCMFSSFTNMNIPGTSLYQRANTTAIEDKSNILTIVTWATLGSSVLVFLVRQCIKFAMGRRVGADDLFILAATVC